MTSHDWSEMLLDHDLQKCKRCYLQRRVVIDPAEGSYWEYEHGPVWDIYAEPCNPPEKVWL